MYIGDYTTQLYRDYNIRDPAVRLGSFGFKKVKKNLKAVRVVSVPLRFGSSRFKKRFGSMSAFRVLPESNSNLAISFQLWHDFFPDKSGCACVRASGSLSWLAGCKCLLLSNTNLGHSLPKHSLSELLSRTGQNSVSLEVIPNWVVSA